MRILLQPSGKKAAYLPVTDAIIENKKDQVAFDPFKSACQLSVLFSGLSSDLFVFSNKYSMNNHILPHGSFLLPSDFVLLADLDGFLQHSLKFLTGL